MREESVFKPLARERALIVEELVEETLVYDLEVHRAHCLNRSAALVWKQCDGRRGIAEITKILKRELGAGVDDKMVWYALEQLGKFRLLEARAGKPITNNRGMTRREAVRRLGLAAMAVPLIISIDAPTSAQATSACLPSGAACSASAQCCNGLCSNGKCA